MNILVTRHPGLVEFVRQAGISIDHHCSHVNDINLLQKGSTIYGVLPLHMVALWCEMGGRYIQLDLTVPAKLRGVELSYQDLLKCKASWCEYEVTRKKVAL